MSIASQVSSHELFGMDHSSIAIAQKAEMLDQMMEKLYVLSENNQYHLKVENEALPMTQVIEQRKQAISLDSGSMSLTSYDQVYCDIRAKELQENR